MKIWRKRVGTRTVCSAIYSIGTTSLLFLTALCMGAAGGCPGTMPPPGPGPGTEITPEIISPASSFGLSLLDQPISVIYVVPTDATNVSGYRVAVSGPSADSTHIGDPQIVQTGLKTSKDANDTHSFSFDPNEAGVGFFRVGIMYQLQGTDQTPVESKGVINVQGPPDPIFVQPAQAVTQVKQGDQVEISFDCRDPENQVQWRLFYLGAHDDPSAPADQLGTPIAVGSGNAGTTTLSTGGLDFGDYQLGVSATDSGQSVVVTATSGDESRIVTIPNDTTTAPIIRVVEPTTVVPPTIAVTSPAKDTSLFQNDPFTIHFAGKVSGDNGPGSIEVFYDTDSNVSNGFTSIQADLPVTATTAAFPMDVPEGTYFIGATIHDDLSSVTAYAVGKIIVVRTTTLTVTKPNSSLPVPPGSSVAIEWQTNAPATSGTVDVFAQAVDGAGNPVGTQTTILNDADITTHTAIFTSNVPGLFQITVKLALRGGTVVQANAPAKVRFSSLPGVLWVGGIAKTTPDFEGAIFGGVNYEDNAGSSILSVGDLDGDGAGELLIAARYAKPKFVNPSGIGPGEAYLVYGGTGTSKLKGQFALNSVGSPALRGITITGIETFGDTDDTDGLASIHLVPDADGDGLSEIAFGFPHSDSIGNIKSATPDDVVANPLRNLLVARGQFYSGGIVILSSTNSPLSEPGVGAVITLDRVGIDFFYTDPTTGNRVTAANEITRAQTVGDLQQFQAGTPPDTPASCTPNATDQAEDTVIGPGFGFTHQLALPGHQTLLPLAFVPFAGQPSAGKCPQLGSPPAGDFRNCRGQLINTSPPDNAFTNPTGHEPMSGYYPLTVLINQNPAPIPVFPAEPFGVRVIGFFETRSDEQSKFGSSITFSSSLNTGAGDLIISAPGDPASDDTGVGYITPDKNLWEPGPNFAGDPPPRPHQYMIETEISLIPSNCGDGRNFLRQPLKIFGQPGDHISNIVGIPDFNLDGRNDILIGAPLANGGKGHVYVAYRREAGVEGDYDLSKLAKDINDPERLNGLLVFSDTADSLGSSLASGIDFNGDGISDIVFSSPDANGGQGEVIVIFGGKFVLSPAGGVSVPTLLGLKTLAGEPVAARITGNTIDGEKGKFGFNVVNLGDVDGDGFADLGIAAPNASPRYDGNPNDANDTLNTLGVDTNFDGVRDVVPGIGADKDKLQQAGLVYVIFGNNHLDKIKLCTGTDSVCNTNADCAQGVTCQASTTINVNQLGKTQLKGFIIAGRRAGDRLGGGDAGDISQGGISSKVGQGRSNGLAAAGDVDGDGKADIVIGSILADPARDPTTDVGVQNGGEVYLIYGSATP